MPRIMKARILEIKKMEDTEIIEKIWAAKYGQTKNHFSHTVGFLEKICDVKKFKNLNFYMGYLGIPFNEILADYNARKENINYISRINPAIGSNLTKQTKELDELLSGYAQGGHIDLVNDFLQLVKTESKKKDFPFVVTKSTQDILIEGYSLAGCFREVAKLTAYGVTNANTAAMIIDNYDTAGILQDGRKMVEILVTHNDAITQLLHEKAKLINPLTIRRYLDVDDKFSSMKRLAKWMNKFGISDFAEADAFLRLSIKECVSICLWAMYADKKDNVIQQNLPAEISVKIYQYLSGLKTYSEAIEQALRLKFSMIKLLLQTDLKQQMTKTKSGWYKLWQDQAKNEHRVLQIKELSRLCDVVEDGQSLLEVLEHASAQKTADVDGHINRLKC